MISALIGYAISGLIIGALARFALPGRRHMGCLATILCGLLGSFIGGLVIRQVSGANRAMELIASIFGAMLVVWLFTRSQTERRYD